MVYTQLTDEQLVEIAKTDKGKPFEVLISRYDKIILRIVNKCYCLSADRDDLKQIAFMALSNAVDSFNGQANFQAFAYTCINNSVLTAMRSSNRKKNEPLKNYVPLSGYGEGDNDKTDIIVDSQIGPEDFLINFEDKKETDEIIKKILSKLEYQIYSLFIEGYSYDEIGKMIKKEEKSVDNAMQRIRKKFRESFNF